jgi:Family of unknown function (DUF5681)
LKNTKDQKDQERKMANYEVGYKKPPQHSQFKPGNRANPHGRRGKAGQRRESDIVYDIMQGRVDFREGGKSKRAPRIEVMIKSYGEAALRGDVRAAEALLKIRAQFAQNPGIEPGVLRLTALDLMAL